MAFVGKNYTGPVQVAVFQLGDDRDTRFGLTLIPSDDNHSLANIVLRYKEDGYTYIGVDKRWMDNGSIVQREERVGPAGYPSRSAWLRA